MHEFGIGRMCRRLRLHGRVDDHFGEVTGLAAPMRVAVARHSYSSAASFSLPPLYTPSRFVSGVPWPVSLIRCRQR